MASNIVPPPPVASWETSDNVSRGSKSSTEERPSTKKAPEKVAPLDAAFLGRVYRSVVLFSGVASVLMGVAFSSTWIGAAFGAGAALAAVLLKTQEMFVRRILRPRDIGPYEGWDRIIPLWVLVPLKYAVVTAALWFGFHSKWLLPVPFVCGFGIVQFVITAKVMGYLLTQRVRTVRETYIETKNVQS